MPPPDPLFAVQAAEMRRIAEAVRYLEHQYRNLSTGGPTPPILPQRALWEGKLIDALAASTGGGTNPTTATCNPYRGTGSDWALDTGTVLGLTNRDDKLSGPIGSYVIFESLNGELRVVYLGCP